jgi:hypothetical protein
METWKLERAGDGRYHVRDDRGRRRAGLIIGGRRRWHVELAGKQWPGAFPSARAAGAALAAYHASAIREEMAGLIDDMKALAAGRA